ncbi:MAG: DNA-3-methyladenine glycosylase [Frankiales bacterium]|nr:DNA-3-methyladenine glycosylase [Frankiales bacterium]
MTGTGLITGDDGKDRCFWHGNLPEYLRYHDEEWGRPVTNDIRLFEKICLEGFQSGLSWLTILRKRENFRAAFAGFRLSKVAAFDQSDIDRLLTDAGIVRNRAKILATIGNARAALNAVPEGLSELLWSFAPVDRPPLRTGAVIPAKTAESIAMAKELKRRGLVFVGPTTAYALMQATGMVNDHAPECWRATRVNAR